MILKWVLIYCPQLLEEFFKFYVNNNNSTIRMGDHQEFIIKEEDENELCFYQKMAKQLEKRLPAQKQFDYVYLPTQQCEIRTQNNFTHQPINQDYCQNSEGQQQEIIQSNSQVLETLKQKLFSSFTDYLQKCSQCIGNIQFQTTNLKRQRRSQLNSEQLLSILLQGNQLLSCEEITKIVRTINKSRHLNKLLPEIIGKIHSSYQNQTTVCFYFILKKFEQCRQQKQAKQILTHIGEYAEQVVSIIKCSNKINQLFFTAYSLDYDQYFTSLIQIWTEVIFNTELNDDLLEYACQLQSQNEEDRTQSNPHFCFNFEQADSDQQNQSAGAPRKLKHFFQ